MRVRTGYSFHHAVGHLPAVIDRLKMVHYNDTAPISDRLSCYSFATWAKLTAEKGLRPIYGVELPVSTQPKAQNPDVDWWTFYAVNDIRPLYALVAQATQGGKLTYPQALAAKCIKIAGERVQVAHLNKQATHLYCALSPSLPKGLYNDLRKANYTFIATSDNTYTTVDDKEFYRVLLGRNASIQTYPQHLLTDNEWRAAVLAEKRTQDQALKTRDNVLVLCRAILPKATLLRPAKPQSLRAMCEAGAIAKGIDLTNNVYRDRLIRELTMIEEKKFEDYFYIVAEMINWAKERMIVGPARGSSCGSLVCYLLNITAVDPIPFGLLFERFIDLTRSDLPDIDVDFSEVHRDEVFAHAEELYGKERVARLGNVNHYKARSALKAAATALRIPDWRINKVIDVMIERTSGDARANEALADTFKQTDVGRSLREEFPALSIAERMEGHPMHASKHAAGIVLTNGPVGDYVAINKATGGAMCDKRDVDVFGLLKIDALGLTQLSVFERCLELIGEQPKAGFLERLPLNDTAAFAVLNRGHFAGVFQFNGIAVQSLAKGIRTTSINDIVAMTALGRPGPMGSGGAQRWARRRNGDEPVTYAHPLVQPFLESTLGVITYQEQVMQIGREVGGLSWKDVTALRKAMSKSMGQDYFDTFGDKWKATAVQKGMPVEVANKFWMDLCTFGNWGFNLSHAVAYGVVSYWCCWLKAHHPVEFAAATLDHENDPVRQIALLRELKDEGITYVPIDPDRSTDRWLPDGNRLLGPLTTVKGIGPASVREIMDCRRTGRPVQGALRERLLKCETPIDSLYPIADAIARIDLKSKKIISKPTLIKQVQCNHEDTRHLIIGVLKKLAPKDLNEAVNVAKRLSNGWRGAYPAHEPHLACNMFFIDDTDQIFCQIGRFDYNELALPMLERGGVGRAIYAVKGTCPRNFRMLRVERIKLLGMLDDTNLVDLSTGKSGNTKDDREQSKT
jgi:DNA polymerase III alpha subunit